MDWPWPIFTCAERGPANNDDLPAVDYWWLSHHRASSIHESTEKLGSVSICIYLDSSRWYTWASPQVPLLCRFYSQNFRTSAIVAVMENRYVVRCNETQNSHPLIMSPQQSYVCLNTKSGSVLFTRLHIGSPCVWLWWLRIFLGPTVLWINNSPKDAGFQWNFNRLTSMCERQWFDYLDSWHWFL